MVTLDRSAGHLVLVTTFTVDPAKTDDLLSALSQTTRTGMRQRVGFVSASLHVSRDKRYVINYAQWRSQADLDAMMSDPTARAQLKAAAAIADSFQPIYYHLRETHEAEAG